MSDRREATIIATNAVTAKLAVGAWFAGLIYALWVSSTGLPPGVLGIGFVYGAILVLAGMFLAPVIIGGGITVALAGLSKVTTGRSDGKPAIFGLGTIIVPVLCFMAGNWAVYHVAEWDPLSLVRHSAAPLEVQCSKPEITFTLGYNDQLDAQQKKALCSCISSSLSAEDQDAITNASRTGNAAEAKRLAGIFGTVLGKCRRGSD